MKPKGEHILLISIGILLIAIPCLKLNYTNYLLIKIFVLSLYSVSFNVLFGYCGLLSFGHAIFFSAGAYALGICIVKFHLHWSIAIFIGISTVFILSLIIGFLSLRHDEIHFAMITLAMSMLFWGIAMKWRSLTGGEDGLIGITRTISVKEFYYICLGIVLISLLVIKRILNSNTGLIIKGLRENPIRVEFSGHSVIKYRMLAMVISAIFTGLSGMLWAFLDRAVTPSIAHWSFSAIPVITSLIGGPQAFWGPVVGTVIYVLAEDIITKYTLYWEFFLGITVIAIVLLFRGGIVGTIKRYLEKG